MDLFEAIRTRQSVRVYQPTDVEEEKLESILSAANRAPSAGNLQGYEIYLTRDNAVKQALAKAARMSEETEEQVIRQWIDDLMKDGEDEGEAADWIAELRRNNPERYESSLLRRWRVLRDGRTSAPHVGAQGDQRRGSDRPRTGD